jgi:hypothetical protein
MLGWTILSKLYFSLVNHINLCTPLVEPGRSVGIVASLLFDFLGKGTEHYRFSKALGPTLSLVQ